MRYPAVLLCLALWCIGCAPVLSSATQYPSPVWSAAQPAASGKGDRTYARTGMEAIRKELRSWEDPHEAAEAVTSAVLKLPDSAVEARCVAASGEMLLVVCHFGPAASQPVAQAIFWHEHSTWESQLYPQAAPVVAAERKEMLAKQGCQLGCYGGVVRARQARGEGPELLVVVDLGITGGTQAEEVHLLRLVDQKWETVWAPEAGHWNYGHATVQLAAKGISQFEVRSSSWLRDDMFAGYLSEGAAGGEFRRFTERWIRKGSAYTMRDRLEEPTPYGTLVRLIHYLSSGADEKAMALVDRDLSLDEARRYLAQKPKRQGWLAVRWGETGFLLDTGKTGKPDLGVRFERAGEEWVLAEIWPTETR